MAPTSLLDLTPNDLVALVEGWGEPGYRGRQLASWVYAKGIREFSAMSNLPKSLRERLARETVVAPPEVAEQIASRDGSTKLVLRLADDRQVHAVVMPDDGRLTVCVSCQVGCGFGCAFCFTGTMGLERNLTPGEIVGQVVAARRILPNGARITHLVYMGMGEPLANYAATVQSLRILTDPKAFGFSPRRITVSTVGLVSGIEKLAKESLKVNLAISLHATSNQIRNRIMPVNKGFAIEELLEACRGFPVAFRQRITFEYVLLDHVNDSAEDARRLVRLLKGIRAKVNLIPFNDWEGSGFQRPPLQRILAFQSLLLEAGIRTTVRWSKGEDIGAACGQLKEALTA
jgi:23S rRNA (adenine2503-C2)-methyltransferase